MDLNADDLARQFNEYNQPSRRGHGPGGRMPRKNSGHALLAGILLRAREEARDKERKATGHKRRHTTDSRAMVAAIRFLKLEDQWDRDENRMDDNGVQKCLGDIMGGHGNLFEAVPGHHSPRQFYLPELSDFNDTEAIKNWARLRGFNVRALMAQYEEAKRAYLTQQR